MPQASGVRLEDFQQLVLSLAVTSVLEFFVRVGCCKVASYNRMMPSPGKGVHVVNRSDRDNRGGRRSRKKGKNKSRFGMVVEEGFTFSMMRSKQTQEQDDSASWPSESSPRGSASLMQWWGSLTCKAPCLLPAHAASLMRGVRIPRTKSSCLPCMSGLSGSQENLEVLLTASFRFAGVWQERAARGRKWAEVGVCYCSGVGPGLLGGNVCLRTHEI